VTRVLLDTSVLIGHERAGGLLAHLPEDVDLAIAAITLAELGVGVELASAEHQAARAAFLDNVRRRIPLVLYDTEVAAAHARLLAEVRRQGRPRGAHDMIIAASALATERAVITADPAGFLDLPGLDVRIVGSD
jgi:tRNA(fMet)-specific endonuclease VapC